MFQFQWLLPMTFVLTFGDTIIDVTCTTREGPAAIGVGATSTVSCSAGETLVSCGIKGTQHIGGARIDPTDQTKCQVLSHYSNTKYFAYPEAVCCTFPSGAISSVTDVVSDPGTSVSATCDEHSVLTGCHVYFDGGVYNGIKGSFTGDQSDPPQTSSWISTDNKCEAQSKSYSTTVTAQARCIQFSTDYLLTCQTTAKYTNYANFGTCHEGFDMFGCNTYTTSKTLDAYYRNSLGQCYVQQDGHANQYANGICCQLTKTDSNGAVSVSDDTISICPPLNTDYANGGRCGPLFDYVRCNKNFMDYAVYCNSDNGWCGITDDHRDAQATDIYDWNPTSCTITNDTDIDEVYLSSTYKNMACGTAVVDTQFHIGDIVQDVYEVIDDICSSLPGQILMDALSVMPHTKYVGKGAKALCESVSSLSAICNLFGISECETDKNSAIVASCWSSEEFVYTGESTADAFKYYLYDRYNITTTYNSINSVYGEKYHETEVTLDNCGNLDNNWIGGVYDSTDNAEQNNIVSEVVEYLVNHGIVSSDNPVNGVSSVKQSASDGVHFTDIVRSKQGLLLHYDEHDYDITTYGLFFCEFNVVDGDFNHNKAQKKYYMNQYLQLALLICVTIIAN